MRWRNDKLKWLHEWHRWFAWYPVTIGKDRVWLETVERICIEIPTPDGPFVCAYDWQYRNCK